MYVTIKHVSSLAMKGGGGPFRSSVHLGEEDSKPVNCLSTTDHNSVTHNRQILNNHMHTLEIDACPGLI